MSRESTSREIRAELTVRIRDIIRDGIPGEPEFEDYERTAERVVNSFAEFFCPDFGKHCDDPYA